MASNEQLTAAQKQLLRKRQDLDIWKKNALKIRSRNRIAGLAIGAFVIGMCILPSRVPYISQSDL